MVFDDDNGRSNPKNITLNGKELPWARKYKYLGTFITNDNDALEEDMGAKRATFISNTLNINQEFNWACSEVKVRINNLFNSTIYGSNLYDINSKMFLQLGKSYNIAVRLLWGLPRDTHCYWIESLAGKHLIASLYSNMITFYNKILKNHKPAVRNLGHLMINDCRTTVKRNIDTIVSKAHGCGILMMHEGFTDLNVKEFKRYCRVYEFPTEEYYRVNLLRELLNVRDQNLYIDNNFLENNQISDMINNLCSD